MPLLLYIAGIIVFSLYFVLFQRAVGGLDADQRRRLTTEGRPPWSYYVLLLVLMAVMVISSHLAARLGAVVSVLGLAVWGQITHQRRLERLGFDAAYRRR